MTEEILPLAMFALLGIILFSGYPVALILGGLGVAFGALGIALDLFLPIEFFNFAPRIWSGIAENLVLTAIPMFILMGTAMERSGIAEDLLRTFSYLLKKVPGALAFSVILLGTVLAAMTGIIGASVVMISVMALPIMLQQSYKAELASGSIAAASTLGILIPPSIMLVMMADLLSVSVGKMFLSALLPGLMLSVLYLTYVVLISIMRPQYAPNITQNGDGRDELNWFSILGSFLPPVALIAFVLGSIFAGWATPTEASGVGAAGALMFAWARGRLNWTELNGIVEQTALTSAMIFMIFMGATAFSYVFRSLGGDELISELVLSTGLGSWGILAILLLTVFLLGFFLDWVEIILIMIPIFLPIIRDLQLGGHVNNSDLIYWFAILMAVNLQTSFLTPPFGFALFYMKGVVPPEITIGHIYRGIVPFVIIQLFGLALVVLFPEIALWLPERVLGD